MLRRLFAFSLFLLAVPVLALAGDATQVHVVTGKEAPELEQFAAQELAVQFGRLFENIEVVLPSCNRQ